MDSPEVLHVAESCKGSARGSDGCRSYYSMVERVELRKQRRKELEMRYETARQRKEV